MAKKTKIAETFAYDLLKATKERDDLLSAINCIIGVKDTLEAANFERDGNFDEILHCFEKVLDVMEVKFQFFDTEMIGRTLIEENEV